MKEVRIMIIDADRAKQIATRIEMYSKKTEKDKELSCVEEVILNAARDGYLRIDYSFFTTDKAIQEAVILDLIENGYNVEMKKQFPPVNSIRIMWGE